MQIIDKEVLKSKLISTDFYKNLNYKINYCDIGASGKIGEPWSLLESNLIHTIGFEPNYDEFIKLQNTFINNSYHNIGLWSSKSTQSYYITSQDYYGNFNFGTSSMYKPNSPYISKNYGNIDLGRVVEKEIKVECDTLDNILYEQLDTPDFIKIDTQGSEYEILKGAEKLLSNNAPIITLEVWTEEIYKNAPLMQDIMSLMHSYGYKLHATQIAAQRFYKTNHRVHCIPRIAGFELFYVKSFENLYCLTPEQLIKQITILEIFGFRDYALFLLENLNILKKDIYDKLYNILIENGKIIDQKYAKIRQ